MSRNTDPPFQRGEYEASLDCTHLMGKEWDFEDIDYAQTSGARKQRSGQMVTVRLVKNSSGFALLPKLLANMSTTAGEYGRVVKGHVVNPNVRGYPIDEFLPAAGVPDGAYFYVVVRGPATVKTEYELGAAAKQISPGDLLTAGTTSAATTGSTTSGRVAIIGSVYAATTSGDNATALMASNIVGRAISGATTNNTNTDLLVDVIRLC